MTNKKPSKQKTKPNRRKVLWIIAFTAVALVVVGGLWLLVFKINAYSPDKDLVKRDAESLFDSIELSGSEVYAKFVDEGCESNTVGLRTNASCSFAGYKYFKASDSMSQNLAAADAQITKTGWQRTFNPQDQADLDKILSDNNRQTVSYSNPYGRKGMSASLGYYKNSSHNSDSKLERLIKDGKIQAPADGEYIYGVYVGASYWGCTNDSLFKICPAPPQPSNFTTHP